MIVNKIEFEFLGDSFLVEGRGRVYTAQLIGEYTADQVRNQLLGQKVPPSHKIIRGIDMLAIERQSNTKIGILFQEG